MVSSVEMGKKVELGDFTSVLQQERWCMSELQANEGHHGQKPRRDSEGSETRADDVDKISCVTSATYPSSHPEDNMSSKSAPSPPSTGPFSASAHKKFGDVVRHPI